MNVNKNIIFFIKKELIISIISLLIFFIAFILYHNQQSYNRIEDIRMLKQSIVNEKNKLKKLIKEYDKEKNFEEKVSYLKIINKPETLDIYQTADNLKKTFYIFFGTKDIQVNYKPVVFKKVKDVKNYVFYKIEMIIPYTNEYLVEKFFSYLNKKYFYVLGGIMYNTKDKKFKVTLYLLGEKGNMKKRTRKRR